MQSDRSNEVDWDWLTGEVRMAMRAFIGQLDTIAATERAGETPVPNLDWTVSELAAHLVCLPSLYRAQRDLDGPFVRPDDFAQFSIDARSHVTSRDLGELSGQLEAEIEGFLQDVGPVRLEPWTLYGQTTTGQNLVAGVLSELIMHGGDLAPIAGTPPEMTRDHALAILPATMALVPGFLDEDRLKRCAGTYHLRFRGGPDYAFHVTDDGAITVTEGKPAKADCHLIADPVTYLMLSLGRTSQVRAALTGKVIAYGRKPWLLNKLNAAKVEGV